ncbi:MAG TPA: phosphopantetheine adenylyltransferase [Candidatus Limnocylindrales bacterium]|nr:phosphopantetheine adenylyltransferase [Candidatus Limnocylindrales bacterium]
MKKFNMVAVGGTFDELHKGHKALLSKSFQIGEKVVIGLSSDEFASRMRKPHVTATYEERFKELQAFLEKSGFANRVQIVPLNDPYGLTTSLESLEALVVSKETESTACKINEIRAKSSLPALKIVTINMIPAENFAPISTTRIRSGEIDRNGHLLKRT